MSYSQTAINGSLFRSQHQITQLIGHLGPKSEPMFKPRDSLMQQHAKTIDSAIALVSCLPQDIGFQRIINNIRDNGRAGQGIERDLKRELSEHPERGCVDEAIDPFKQI